MKNIWDSYLNLFTNENPIVVIATITATITVLTFIINYLLKPFYKRIQRSLAKIKVDLGMSLQFMVPSSFGASTLPPLVTVKVTNRDRISRYIQSPTIRTSKKINGDRYFSVPTSKGTFPKKLEPGEQVTFEYDSVSINNQLLVHLNSADKIGIIITDTTGKKYKSNRFTASYINGHIRAASNQNPS